MTSAPATEQAADDTFKPVKFKDADTQARLDEAKAAYVDTRDQLIKSSYVDREFMLKRFFNAPDFDAAAKNNLHVFETYKNSVQQYRAFKVADEYLNKIPVGEFKMSLDLFSDVHKLTMEGVYRHDEVLISKIFPTLVPPPGQLEVLGNFGFSPLTKKPLTEAQYKAIMDNDHLGFIEAPFLSKPGRRVGIIKFPTATQSKKELQKLLDWYEINKTVLHPIELAANFQRKFISIHPFHNGNGRTSRLFMDRILVEHGYPPAVLSDMNLDIYLHPDQWVDEVASGVLRYQYLAGQSWISSGPSVGNDFTSAFSYASKNIAPANVTGMGNLRAEIKIQNEYFYLNNDGFFYNSKGIPHTLQEKTFYPISDETYLLYAQNGKLKKADVSDFNPATDPWWMAYEINSRHRKDNKFGTMNFANHAKFMNSYNRKGLNLKEYKVMPYSIIEKANQSADFHIYPWQKNVFRHAVKIEDDFAMAVLSPNTLGRTTFENAFHNGSYASIHDMLGQYQLMELRFAKYERFAKQNMPEMLEDIAVSREKLFNAAKVLLKEYHGKISSLPQAELDFIRKTPNYRLFEEYISFSPLQYETYAEAAVKTKDHIYMLRSDMSVASKIGFIPEGKMRNFLDYVPFSEEIITYLKKKSEKEGADPKLVQFVERVLSNPFRNKGVDTEFQRMYVDMSNHAANATAKEFNSFSTTTELYNSQFLSKEGTGAFAAIEGTPYDLFVVKLKKDKVLFNISSGFTGEYEVLAPKVVTPFSIVKKFKKEDLLLEFDKMTPEELEMFQKFQRDIFSFDMSKIKIE